MKFNSFLQEGKQVGDLYHFTDVYQFEQILTCGFKMYSYNGVFSCTRNAGLAQSMMGDITKRNGHVVRINIDGEGLSDKYKIKPIIGYKKPIDPRIKFNSDRIPKNWEEREEFVYDKNKKYVDIKKYVKSITLSPVTIEQVEFLKKIEHLIPFPYEYVRKFFKENHNESFNEYIHDLLVEG